MKATILTSILLLLFIFSNAQSPIASYPFNGNADDISGNGNHGTVNGATLTEDRFGNPDSAYEFDGDNDYIQKPDDLLPSEFSFSCWIKADATGTYNYVDVGSVIYAQGAVESSSWADFAIGIQEDGGSYKIRVEFGSNMSGLQFYADSDITFDKWIHVVVIFNNGNVEVYLDNSLVTTNTIGISIPNHSGAPTYIGHRYLSSNISYRAPFKGLIDDIMLYDYAIESTTIDSLYSIGGWPTAESCTVLDLPFSGTADDISGNGHNGAVNGATLTEDRFGNPNGAYLFDGTDDFISVNHHPQFDFSNSFSVSFFINVNELGPNNQWFINKSWDPDTLHWGIGMDQFGEISILFDISDVNQGEQTGVFVQTDTWEMYTLTYDNTKLKLFRNDEIVWQKAVTGNMSTNNLDISIGYFPHTNMPPYGYFLNGKMDEIKIYDCALTDEEVDSTYHSGGWDEACLVADYPFTGSALDISGNSNHGTVNGAALTPDRFGNLNSAYYFDGVDDYIDILVSNRNLTYSAWVKTNNNGINTIFTNSPGGSPQVGYGVNFSLSVGRPLIAIASMDGTSWGDVGSFRVWSDYILSDNEWHLVVAVIDTINSANCKIYVDGELTNSTILGDITGIDLSVLEIPNYFIGKETDNDYPFSGNIDDIKIFQCALDSAEIQDLYEEGTCYETIYDTITTEVFDTTYITVYDSISVTDTLIIDVELTGIPGPDNINTILVYPNPAVDFVIINTGDYISMADYEIKIYNTLSEIVWETVVNQPEYQIDVNSFGGYGTYFINIYDDTGALLDVRKLILQ